MDKLKKLFAEFLERQKFYLEKKELTCESDRIYENKQAEFEAFQMFCLEKQMEELTNYVSILEDVFKCHDGAITNYFTNQ